MNERIRELAVKSFDVGLDRRNFEEFSTDSYGIEKFARLIIEDCAYIADKNHSLGVTTGNFMKRYFGVEE